MVAGDPAHPDGEREAPAGAVGEQRPAAAPAGARGGPGEHPEAVARPRAGDAEADPGAREPPLEPDAPDDAVVRAVARVHDDARAPDVDPEAGRADRGAR